MFCRCKGKIYKVKVVEVGTHIQGRGMGWEERWKCIVGIQQTRLGKKGIAYGRFSNSLTELEI